MMCICLVRACVYSMVRQLFKLSRSRRHVLLLRSVSHSIAQGKAVVETLHHSVSAGEFHDKSNLTDETLIFTTRWYTERGIATARLLLRSNRNSYTHFRLVPKSMTLDDLEGSLCTLFQNTWVFRCSLWKFEWRWIYTVSDKDVALVRRCDPLAIAGFLVFSKLGYTD